jgi:hypothetical protein
MNWRKSCRQYPFDGRSGPAAKDDGGSVSSKQDGKAFLREIGMKPIRGLTIACTDDQYTHGHAAGKVGTGEATA